MWFCTSMGRATVGVDVICVGAKRSRHQDCTAELSFFSAAWKGVESICRASPTRLELEAEKHIDLKSPAPEPCPNPFEGRIFWSFGRPSSILHGVYCLACNSSSCRSWSTGSAEPPRCRWAIAYELEQLPVVPKLKVSGNLGVQAAEGWFPTCITVRVETLETGKGPSVFIEI
mmetsp:Transcript_122384/g.391581  ORF Transcript_122384/g.391581 Transcript_122384/m.391581 type:complete len:173 (+) Transcript_122384:155-673(+)